MHVMISGDITVSVSSISTHHFTTWGGQRVLQNMYLEREKQKAKRKRVTVVHVGVSRGRLRPQTGVGQSRSLACDDSLHPGGDSGYQACRFPPRRPRLSSCALILSSRVMGNSASSGRGHHEDTVDFGYLTPQGIYTGPRDWNQTIVTQLIVERKLAPFYRPLEEYDESWDDDQILAARKEPPEMDGAEPSRAEPATSPTVKGHAKRPSVVKEPARNPEAAIYHGAMECPICFLVRRDIGFILCSPTLCEHVVLPPEHKSFTML